MEKDVEQNMTEKKITQLIVAENYLCTCQQESLWVLACGSMSKNDGPRHSLYSFPWVSQKKMINYQLRLR